MLLLVALAYLDVVQPKNGWPGEMQADSQAIARNPSSSYTPMDHFKSPKSAAAASLVERA